MIAPLYIGTNTFTPLQLSTKLMNTVEERKLLSVAYKNVIGARCMLWRIVSFFYHKM